MQLANCTRLEVNNAVFIFDEVGEDVNKDTLKGNGSSEGGALLNKDTTIKLTVKWGENEEHMELKNK
ncbi:hypothetical protein QUF88_04070 [Bacillus sp. DX1.1]|uniref:hypothetical protein n=1 Tax=Bacillus sp. DX3.1 TaxID=3052091 RepID=UPI0025708DE3|nr:hypothetical protein [Bacillus sp. DX3.1]MDM5153081.1 hypothetical protein [Bacillus sp. DX1.1]WJE82054.1 hypothetical protein QRE67_01595 [Bacillus sp. DX3.1]